MKTHCMCPEAGAVLGFEPRSEAATDPGPGSWQERDATADHWLETGEEWTVDSCLAAARAGDEEAVRILVKYANPLVLRVLRAYWLPADSAASLAQAVIEAIMARLDQFAPGDSFADWVARVAVELGQEHLNCQTPAPPAGRAGLSAAAGEALQVLAAPVPETELPGRPGAVELVGRLLEPFQPANRLVASLVHIEGCPVAEVRRLTGWNELEIRGRAAYTWWKLKRNLAGLLER